MFHCTYQKHLYNLVHKRLDEWKLNNLDRNSVSKDMIEPSREGPCSHRLKQLSCHPTTTAMKIIGIVDVIAISLFVAIIEMYRNIHFSIIKQEKRGIPTIPDNPRVEIKLKHRFMVI